MNLMNANYHTQFIRFGFNELNIQPEEIYSLIGLGSEEASGPFSFYTNEVFKFAQVLQNICGFYHIFENIAVNPENNTLSIAGSIFKTGKTVTRLLRNSEHIALFMGTAGNELENYAREQMKLGNMPEGYIADIIGSEIAQAVADKIQQIITENMKGYGLNVSNSYSPGYCEWNVAEQQTLFKILPDNPCHIILSESSLMSPIKSVSGIIGIGKEVKFNPYTCQICDMKDCVYKNKKMHSNQNI